MAVMASPTLMVSGPRGLKKTTDNPVERDDEHPLAETVGSRPVCRQAEEALYVPSRTAVGRAAAAAADCALLLGAPSGAGWAGGGPLF